MSAPGTLFIHGGFPVSLQPLQDWISEDGSCSSQVQTWDCFEPRRLGELAVDLIVPITCGDEPRAAELFRWLRSNPINASVLAVLLDGVPEPTLRQAVEVADELLFWPVDRMELKARLRRVRGFAWDERQAARRVLMAGHCREQLVGEDPAFRKVVETLPRLASAALPVLISGETGTGKEVVARTIHHLSPRQESSFIPVDCPSLPDQLFENELFGHVKGAFTDARRDQKGLVALAESGTLFLDEVNTLPWSTQAKLLRFLQERSYRRLGEECFRQADVRVLAASNSSIEALVANSQFRADLYYRLNVLRVHLPPLRERPADVPLLALHCLRSQCPGAASQGVSISPSGLRKLGNHHWPGNIRELFSVVQRAWVASGGSQILPAHIQLAGATSVDRVGDLRPVENFSEAKARTIEAFERRYVERTLQLHEGNITRAAEAAGKERRSFGRLVKKYGIDTRGSTR